MAGESPDKSGQQKSSGTARSERDPRLAVLHEQASPAESGGKQDTATAVFRTKPVESDEDAERAEGVEGTENASEGPEAASTPSEPAEPEEGDARLRAAVAAWVGKGDGDAAGAAAEEPEAAEGDAKPEAVAESDTPTRAEEADGSGADSADASADEPAASSADASDVAEVADDAAAADAEAGANSDHDADDEAADKPAASDDAAAAVATTDEDEDKDEPAVSGDASDETRVSEGRDETRVSEGREESHATESAGAEEPEGNKSGGDSEPEAADDAADAYADAVTKGAETTGADVEDADEDAGDTGDSEPEVADDADAAAKGAETSDADGTDGTDDTEPTADKRGIDQPTAVFKTVRRDQIDQPTTALKIARPSAKSEEKPEPESPAERTSQFVPLRRDDARPAPAPRKPGTTGSAAAPATRPSPEPAPAPSLSGAERTRQQPMPPRPPLDLLAELTNTPPPPETPVRTAVRRVKIWTPLVLLLLIVFAIVQAVRPLPTPVLALSADPTYTFKGGDPSLAWPGQGQSAVTVDGVGSLGTEGAQKPVPIASVAKVMTAYVVLKEHPLAGKEEGEKITVDQQAEDESKRPEESTAPLKKGQRLTEKQLLQLLMIPSGNNAARLFARWDSPNEAAFVAKMNEEAKALGMNSTTYTDPSGLKKTTVSTAADQLKLAKAVMQNDVFRQIVDTPQIDIEGIDGTIYNNNTLLLQPGVSGIKTGSSTPAGGNLLWSANTIVDGKKLWIYGAVMGQQAGTGRVYDSLQQSLDKSLKLIQSAQKAVTSATVVKKGDVVGYVDDGFGGKTPVVATENVKAMGWPGLKVELSVTGNGKKISNTATAGTKVGMVTVGSGAGKVSAPVALQQDLKAPTFGQKLTRIS
ncbi:serine hydrolase [Streptomyces sp. NPDC051020]|uniref:D-alanyl-D-alanine carboxypeptidase family protein n=1 Tax=Streptomyces sp. NPDC051020 TaxID=3155409 RepID=UPI00344A992A